MTKETNTFSLIVMDRARRRWRFIAFLAIIFLFFTVPNFSQKANLTGYIARVDITGFITSDKEQLATLEQLETNAQVKAITVYIDSPGGTMVGGFDIYNSLRRINEVKPVVCVMGTTAASAGYMVALGCPYIIASPASLTGSIGVFMPLVDATGLADKIGIQSASVASGSLKMATSPLEKQTPEAKRYLQNMVTDLQKTFMHYVTKHRQMNDEHIKIISDGRALTGRRALELGLIDALGDVTTAKKWLVKHHSISHDTPVRDVTLIQEKSFFDKALSSLSFVESFSASVQSTGIMASMKP
ncbi:MAG: protease-4 [Alphaproteobacteria bacterium]